MSREQLFNQWLSLKEDIQNLAAIVQDDIELTEQDLLSWLEQVDEVKIKLNNIQLKTVRRVKLK